MNEPTVLPLSESVWPARHPDRGPGTGGVQSFGEAAPSFVADRLEDLLELRDRARVRGYRALAQEYTDRIVAEVWPDTFGLNGPGGHAA